MHNENSTAGKEQVPQDTLERILKLVHSGLSPEDISFVIKIDIETVHQIIANDSKHSVRVVRSIKERSAEYRCTLSKRLMVCPVMDSDGNFYEQSILVADPSHSINQFMPSKKLRAKIEDFSKESLNELERCLLQRYPLEDILELTAECLSVLCPEAWLESALRVLSAVEGETMRKLYGKLRGLVPEQMLYGLMNQLARKLPSHALCLAALIILEPRSERAFEEAFRCFAELLSQVALDAGAIDLAEEVSERLSSSQLDQVNAALGAYPREGGDKLDGLRLKQAYALLREGEVEAATRLVSTLRSSPRLEKELLRFYDEAGLNSRKVPILEQMLSAKLEEISRDSPSLAETLSILQQLHKAELVEAGEEIKQVKRAQDVQIQRLDEKLSEAEATLKQALIILREDVGALCRDLDHALSQCKQVQETMLQRLEEQAQKSEANALKLNRHLAKTSLQDTREALYNLHEVTLPTYIYSYADQLHRTNLATGEQSSHPVPSYTFKQGCHWSEVPGGSLLITGGFGWTVTREVVRIDVVTFEVSSQTPMLTPRGHHAAVHHTQHLYVLGGYDGSRSLSECERYVYAHNRWEALPPLPKACGQTSGVVVEKSLYALGGVYDGSRLDLVQKLSIESLTWELMELRLPHATSGIPCFKVRNTEVYLVVNKTLYSFTGLEVVPLKTLTEGISSWYGVSYYRRGTLYCSSNVGAVRSYEIGSLSN
jgi:hypothetical protein